VSEAKSIDTVSTKQPDGLDWQLFFYLERHMYWRALRLVLIMNGIALLCRTLGAVQWLLGIKPHE